VQPIFRCCLCYPSLSSLPHDHGGERAREQRVLPIPRILVVVGHKESRPLAVGQIAMTGADGVAATLGAAANAGQEAPAAGTDAEPQATAPAAMGAVAADAAVGAEETTPTPAVQPPSTTTANSAARKVRMNSN
jgi:hypothetical protein